MMQPFIRNIDPLGVYKMKNQYITMRQQAFERTLVIHSCIISHFFNVKFNHLLISVKISITFIPVIPNIMFLLTSIIKIFPYLISSSFVKISCVRFTAIFKELSINLYFSNNVICHKCRENSKYTNREQRDLQSGSHTERTFKMYVKMFWVHGGLFPI